MCDYVCIFTFAQFLCAHFPTMSADLRSASMISRCSVRPAVPPVAMALPPLKKVAVVSDVHMCTSHDQRQATLRFKFISSHMVLKFRLPSGLRYKFGPRSLTRNKFCWRWKVLDGTTDRKAATELLIKRPSFQHIFFPPTKP